MSFSKHILAMRFKDAKFDKMRVLSSSLDDLVNIIADTSGFPTRAP